jgi:CubicO group peptidase (beta-lactamase class C family)
MKRRVSALAALTMTVWLADAAGAELQPAAIRRATEYSAAVKGTSLVMYQEGRVVFEKYGNGGSRSERKKIYSGTKGFWALAALAAQQDGILDLDERVSASVREWAEDERKVRITVRQLLNFTSGLAEAGALHNDGWTNRNAHALKQDVVGATGGSFIYGPAAWQVFHEVFRRKLAAQGEMPTRYLERRVLRPLGLGKQRYLEDKAGNPLLATGFMMTPSQWARMGQLLLAGGEPVLSGGGISEAFRGTLVNPMFGLGFWNNRLAGSAGVREVDPEELLELKWHRQNWRRTCLCHAAPRDLVASIGSGGQRLYVIPSMSLVIVRQGTISRFSDQRFLRLLFGEG